MKRPISKEYSQEDVFGELHVDRRSYCYGLNKYIDYLESNIKDYAKFCVACDRDGLPLLPFEDYLKLD